MKIPETLFTVLPTLIYIFLCASFIIIQNEMQESMTLYPNPASDFITITKTNSYITHVELVDIAGNCVLREELNDTTVINISAYCKGLYILKCYSSNGLAASKKVVIQ